MTAKTVDAALALEADRGAQYRAEIWRAGYAAGLDAAAARVEEGGKAWSPVASDIRSLPIPEDRT